MEVSGQINNALSLLWKATPGGPPSGTGTYVLANLLPLLGIKLCYLGLPARSLVYSVVFLVKMRNINF